MAESKYIVAAETQARTVSPPEQVEHQEEMQPADSLLADSGGRLRCRAFFIRSFSISIPGLLSHRQSSTMAPPCPSWAADEAVPAAKASPAATAAKNAFPDA